MAFALLFGAAFARDSGVNGLPAFGLAFGCRGGVLDLAPALDFALDFAAFFGSFLKGSRAGEVYVFLIHGLYWNAQRGDTHCIF